MASPYIGRLAPSPTGYLHLGHARTFWVAHERARQHQGRLLLRNDDLDHARCRPEFVDGFVEDLRWLGLHWDEPIIHQSQRLSAYREALARLHAAGLIFPCHHSRRDVAEAAGAPHETNGIPDDEPIYPRSFRPASGSPLPHLENTFDCNWRFRVPDGRRLEFTDLALGPQSAVAGEDFGDFLVWRKDGMPSYQLACVVDDIEFGITEVVRGADLIRSTFRQILLFEALGAKLPAYHHCDLVNDESGQRLAKRNDALSLRTLRHNNVSPESILDRFRSKSSL